MRVNVMYSTNSRVPKFRTGLLRLLTIFSLFLLFHMGMRFTPKMNSGFLTYFLYGQNAVLSVQDENSGLDFHKGIKAAGKLLFGMESLSPKAVVAAQVPVLRVYDPAEGKGALEAENPSDEIPRVSVAPTPVIEARETKEASVKISNSAGVEFDKEALLASPIGLKPINPEEPQVLIVHTHTTEAYTPTEAHPYEASGDDRTKELGASVARVGEELTDALRERGVNVLHDKTVHDSEFSKSYTNTLPTIESYLKKYPSIQVVIDLHRDALYYEDGTKLRVTAEIDQKTMAQAMLVVGTDRGGLEHPSWQENLKFALHLQKNLEERYGGLMRAVNIAPYRYNQHTTKASVILEMGASGNTLEEVLLSCPYLADGIVKTLTES